MVPKPTLVQVPVIVTPDASVLALPEPMVDWYKLALGAVLSDPTRIANAVCDLAERFPGPMEING